MPFRAFVASAPKFRTLNPESAPKLRGWAGARRHRWTLRVSVRFSLGFRVSGVRFSLGFGVSGLGFKVKV